MSRKRTAEGPLVSHEMEAKLAGLMHDYLHLQQEFVELKDRLQAGKTRKWTLLAEVRFLRRRLKQLKEIPSHLKGNETATAFTHRESSAARNEKAVTLEFAPGPSSLSPKNNPLGSTEIPVFLEPLGGNGSDESGKPKLVNDNVRLVTALKTSALRNRPNVFVTAMAEKRKISCQDQISLECN